MKEELQLATLVAKLEEDYLLIENGGVMRYTIDRIVNFYGHNHTVTDLYEINGRYDFIRYFIPWFDRLDDDTRSEVVEYIFEYSYTLTDFLKSIRFKGKDFETFIRIKIEI